MRRRAFLTAIAGSVAWPMASRAQQTRKIPRVGVLWHAANAEEEAAYLAAFQEGLKSLGYLDGRTIALEHRFPNEIPERFVRMAAELAANKPDVLVAVTPVAALAAKQATSTVPIVFVAVHDPVR